MNIKIYDKIEYGYIGEIDNFKCLINFEIYNFDLENNLNGNSVKLKRYFFHPFYFTKDMEISNYKYVIILKSFGANEVSSNDYNTVWKKLKSLTCKHTYIENGDTLEKDELCDKIEEAILEFKTTIK